MDNIHIYNTPQLLANALANYFNDMIRECLGKSNKVNIALSGGNTPILFFNAIIDLQIPIPWDKTHIYWVDERCVSPQDLQSNYGMTKKHLLNKIDIPSENIHRIFGEEEPEKEAKRYSKEVLHEVGSINNWPVFNWILLGLGGDGHTASLFPESPLLTNASSISAVAKHPETGQKRITLTLPVLNQASKITFLVSGSSKAQIVSEILNSSDSDSTYPATRVKPNEGTIEWYLDKTAAENLF